MVWLTSCIEQHQVAPQLFHGIVYAGMGGEWLTALTCLCASFALLPNLVNCEVMKGITTYLSLIISYGIVEERRFLLVFRLLLQRAAMALCAAGCSQQGATLALP